MKKLQVLVKTKDPRRVEAGKRLGMISKQAKEKKALREREQSAVEAKEKNDDWFPTYFHRFTSCWYWVCWISWVGIVLRLR